MCENVYDMIIVGSGPAGLTAGIYGKRAGLKVVILESGFIQGGQIVNTYEVDNYPGMPGISGLELAEKLKEHVTGFGVEIARGKVKGISLDGEWKIVHTKKADYRGKAVILAAGAVHRKLEVPGEEELAGMESLTVQPVTERSLKIRQWLLSAAGMWLWKMQFSWREAVNRCI